MGTVAILMGSKVDLEFAKKIGESAKALGLKSEYRVASAHRTPKKLLEVIDSLNARASKGEKIVIIAVVGLSNALSGFAACATHLPIVTCPPNEEDLASSLRMPKGVSHATILGAENAALYAAKILSLAEAGLDKRIRVELDAYAKKVEDADVEARSM